MIINIPRECLTEFSSLMKLVGGKEKVTLRHLLDGRVGIQGSNFLSSEVLTYTPPVEPSLLAPIALSLESFNLLLSHTAGSEMVSLEVSSNSIFLKLPKKEIEVSLLGEVAGERSPYACRSSDGVLSILKLIDDNREVLLANDSSSEERTFLAISRGERHLSLYHLAQRDSRFISKVSLPYLSEGSKALPIEWIPTALYKLRKSLLDLGDSYSSSLTIEEGESAYTISTGNSIIDLKKLADARSIEGQIAIFESSPLFQNLSLEFSTSLEAYKETLSKTKFKIEDCCILDLSKLPQEVESPLYTLPIQYHLKSSGTSVVKLKSSLEVMILRHERGSCPQEAKHLFLPSIAAILNTLEGNSEGTKLFFGFTRSCLILKALQDTRSVEYIMAQTK